MKVRIPVIWFDTIDSTNTEAKRQILSVDKMSVFAAYCQTAGRGQRGNKWLSAPGENLTFTIALRMEGFYTGSQSIIDAKDQFLLSEAAALSVTDWLETQGITASIKWPNDIYVRDKKICGILIENILDGNGLDASIIGIGLNLRQTDFPIELNNPTSVAKIKGSSPGLEEALEGILDSFMVRLNQAFNTKDVLRDSYLDKLYRRDRVYTYRDCRNDTLFEGKIKGISDLGLLLVEMPDRSIEEFSFKEIGYVI